MFYRENGQFKTSYRADQQILPIAQDRVALYLTLAFAFCAVPLMASDYTFRAILIPFLIFSLAAIGVNILVGYCGQISLGSGAFMAVGAYAAYNFFVRVPGMPLIVALILGGVCAMLFGILFGLPSLRVKGLYLAVATLRRSSLPTGCFCASGGSPIIPPPARSRCPTCRSLVCRWRVPCPSICSVCRCWP